MRNQVSARSLPLGASRVHDDQVDLRSVLERATERSGFGDDGKSGAALERVTLPDGTRVVVKRYDASGDLVMRLTGDRRGREVELLRAGLFEALPPEVGHAVLDGWFEGDLGVVVMRDLGDAVLGWHDRLDPDRCRAVARGTAALHRHFLDAIPSGVEDLLTPLDHAVGLFQPERIRPYAAEQLVDFALRGWEYWPEVARGEVPDAVLALALDPTPLVRALQRWPATLLHGDLATVNMAFEGERLTLIDWGMAFAAPGAVDVGRFLAGCGHMLDVPPDGFLELYRSAAGQDHDEDALALGLLTGLVWLGWNKALDISEHPDPQIRERERAALPWWLARVERGLALL
jgi:hypothetical protein